MIFGVATNDLSYKENSYTIWHSMIRRCYSEVYQKSKPTYKECKVSNDWLLHSNFKRWYDSNYIEDWQLDKDLLSGNMKLYSEETCCFLPSSLNSLIIKQKKSGDLPEGVYFKKTNGKYVAQLSQYSKLKRESGYICLHHDPEYCFNKYKEFKEAKIKELTNKYKDLLSNKVYNALLLFEVTR